MLGEPLFPNIDDPRRRQQTLLVFQISSLGRTGEDGEDCQINLRLQPKLFSSHFTKGVRTFAPLPYSARRIRMSRCSRGWPSPDGGNWTRPDEGLALTALRQRNLVVPPSLEFHS